MSGFLFDTNVLLDIATADPTWIPWSERQFRVAAAQGPILINPIIYAELAPAFAQADDLDRWLDPSIFSRLPLPYPAGWLAAHHLPEQVVGHEMLHGQKHSKIVLYPDFSIPIASW